MTFEVPIRAALLRGGPWLDIRTRDGRNSLLLFPKEIFVELENGRTLRFRMPASSGSDGASIPEIASIISHLIGLGIDPFGDYWPGAYVHDNIYRRLLEIWNGVEWVKAQLERSEADELFRKLMFSLGTDEAKANVIYLALSKCGQAAWDEDAKIAAAS